jgi:Flp pilus assembly pilin Flp
MSTLKSLSNKNRRGANMVEYLIIVALLALGGFTAFGQAVNGKINQQAAAVAH